MIKKIILLGTLLCLVVLFASSNTITVFASMSFGGHIIKKDGTSIEVVEFLNPLKTGSIGGEYKNNWVEFSADILKDIWILSLEGKNIMNLKIMTRDGREFIIYNALFYDGTNDYDRIVYTVFNEITGGSAKQITSLSDVSNLIFDEDIGELKRCPKCKKVFPSDYLFCPYDKEELEWHHE